MFMNNIVRVKGLTALRGFRSAAEDAKHNMSAVGLDCDDTIKIFLYIFWVISKPPNM